MLGINFPLRFKSSIRKVKAPPLFSNSVKLLKQIAGGKLDFLRAVFIHTHAQKQQSLNKFAGSYASNGCHGYTRDAPISWRDTERKVVCVSPEWCRIDKTALWQFVNNAVFCVCECECILKCWHTRKQAIKLSTQALDKHTHTYTHASLLLSALQVFSPFLFFLCPFVPAAYLSERRLNHLAWRARTGRTHWEPH